MIKSFVNPSNEDIENASNQELLSYYAARASVNPQLNVPSIPQDIDRIHPETSDKYGTSVADMAISDLQGVLQNFFVGLLNAKRVLEVGSFTGSSAIYFANALKRNGVSPGPDADGNMPVVGLDISEEFASVARDNFDRAGISDYVKIIVGDARKNIAKLEGQQFEVVFIDADKSSYKTYYDTIVEKNLLAKGGLIIIDNTALYQTVDYLGKPVDNAETEAIMKMPYSSISQKQASRALHDFNEYIRNDPRTKVVMFPIFTGISFVRILDNV